MVKGLGRLFFGDDIFLSYSRHASTYVAGLASALAAKGFSCRFDQWGSHPGEAIPEELLRALRQSAMLVVVGTEEAGHSRPVTQEIEEFIPTERLIVPIDLDGSIESAIWWPKLKGLAVTRDYPQPIQEVRDDGQIPHTPSSEVIDRIVNSVTFTRRNRRLRRFAGGTLTLFALFLLGAFVAAGQVGSLKRLTVAWQKKAQDAASQQRDAEAKLGDTKQQLTLKQADVSRLQTNVTQLNQASNDLTAKNSLLSQQSSSLQEQNSNLERRALLLRTRIAARSNLDVDPVIAYRLAQIAYPLGLSIDGKDPENKELLLTALWRLDFPYQKLLKACSMEDFQAPYALLRCSEPGKEESLLRVLNTVDLTIEDTQQRVDDFTRVLIAPVSTSWRLLTSHFTDNHNKSFELWGSDGKQIGKPLLTTELGFLKRCSPNKVAAYQPNAWWFLWDLGSESPVRVDRKLNSGTIAGDRLDFLGCRADGVAVLGGPKGIALFSDDGSELKQSETPANLTPRLMETMAGLLSKDSSFLALVDYSYQGPAIWSPQGEKLAWLRDHVGGKNSRREEVWGVDAIAWGPHHEFVFSGHTEFKRDVTVEIFDAAKILDDPKPAPRVLYRSDEVVRSLAVSPDGQKVAVADAGGRVSIVRVSDGAVLASGKHDDVESVHWSGDYIFSSSGDYLYRPAHRELRIWSGKADFRAGWTYATNPQRRYGMCAATDPSSHWHAVSYTGTDGKFGVELREVFGTERKFLEFQAPTDWENTCQVMDFTQDGQWLMLLSRKRLRLWETKHWEREPYELRPDKDDEVFKELTYESNAPAVRIGPPVDVPASLYRIVLDGSAPRLSRVDTPARLTYSRWCGTPGSESYRLADRIWQSRLPNRAYPWKGDYKCPFSQWFARIGCRDNMNFSAVDCDVQFVPTDLELLLGRYDSLTWSPQPGDLDAYTSPAKQPN